MAFLPIGVSFFAGECTKKKRLLPQENPVTVNLS